MIRTRLIPALLLSLLAAAAAAQPVSYTFTVDGVQNCLQFDNLAPGIPAFVPFKLEAGNWRAQVVSSTIYRDTNLPDVVDSTMGLIIGYSTAPSFSLAKAARITVAGNPGDVGDLQLFFVDNLCTDNGGSAVVKFTKLK